MSLQFIGETGVYFPDKNAVKITAIDGDRIIDCYIEQSALDALSKGSSRDPLEIVRRFDARRLDCEIAAMVKFRRSTAPVLVLEITAADLAVVGRVDAA